MDHLLNEDGLCPDHGLDISYKTYIGDDPQPGSGMASLTGEFNSQPVDDGQTIEESAVGLLLRDSSYAIEDLNLMFSRKVFVPLIMSVTD